MKFQNSRMETKRKKTSGQSCGVNYKFGDQSGGVSIIQVGGASSPGAGGNMTALLGVDKAFSGAGVST